MSLYETLRPWQKNVVDKFKDRDAYGLFLDMGTGKTIISLAFAEVNKCNKVIVVSINSKATETIDEDGSWLYWASRSDIPYKLYTKKELKSKKFKGFDNTPGVLLINYESLWDRKVDKKKGVVLRKELIKFIDSGTYQNIAIIIDESHKVKDISSTQTKAIQKLKAFAKLRASKTYMYLLTGTPFTKDFVDLYSQLNLLGCAMNKTQFKDNFCIMGQIPGLADWQQPIKAYKNIDSLYSLVHQYAITIQSEDVQDLPEKIFVFHKCKQTDYFEYLTREKYPCGLVNKLLEERNCPLIEDTKEKKLVNNPFYRNYAYPDIKWLAETVGTFWLRAREMSIGFQGNSEEYIFYDRERLEKLRDFLETNEDNYILFYNFTPELCEIYDICEELGYNIDVYSGGDLKSLHYYDIYAKQTPEEQLTNKKNIIIANFKSGSTGKNWQLYNKCIVFSIPTFGDWQQGLKRVHRYGQKFDCIYHIFYQTNWLDIGMKKALEEKTEYNEDMFEDDFKRVQVSE